MNNDYEIMETSLPALNLMGVFVSTDMERCGQDAPALWEKTFMALAQPVFAASGPMITYGLSFYTSENSFDYWAALPAVASLPEGMQSAQVPSGKYLKCAINSLAEIGPGFMALWEHIQNTQRELDFSRPSIEEYPSEFMGDGSMMLYMPVK